MRILRKRNIKIFKKNKTITLDKTFTKSLEKTVQELQPKYNSIERATRIPTLLNYLEQDGFWREEEIMAAKY